MIYLIYVLSIAYCVTMMYKSYNRKYEGNNPIGPTPGMETIAILIMAPVLMAVDVSATWLRKYKEYRDEKSERII